MFGDGRVRGSLNFKVCAHTLSDQGISLYGLSHPRLHGAYFLAYLIPGSSLVSRQFAIQSSFSPYRDLSERSVGLSLLPHHAFPAISIQRGWAPKCPRARITCVSHLAQPEFNYKTAFERPNLVSPGRPLSQHVNHSLLQRWSNG